VYVYFDNDAKVKAPRDALALARLVDATWKPTERGADLLPARRRSVR
jgi:uncharacterized protein YecE (DUF72 family)